MRRSTIPLSCARFIMLSLSGAQQISGKSVRMSIFIRVAQAPSLRSKSKSKLAAHSTLFHDLECGALTMARSRTGEERANCLNGLTVSPDDAANVALSKLHSEYCHSAVWNFREHHLVRIIDELAN